MMKTCAEIRRENLEALISEAGTIEALAEKTGSSSGYLSQLRTQAPDSRKKRPRDMGDNVARRLEDGMNKETGWMDHDHSDDLTGDGMFISDPQIARIAQTLLQAQQEGKEYLVAATQKDLDTATELAAQAAAHAKAKDC